MEYLLENCGILSVTEICLMIDGADERKSKLVEVRRGKFCGWKGMNGQYR